MTRKSEKIARTLSELFHYRWAMPALAELHLLGGGAKCVVLYKRMGVRRDSLVTALEGLMKFGLIIRNPGYGHPMRPEFLWTTAGRSLAALCADLMAKLNRMSNVEVAKNKWSLPVVFATANTDGRFNAIKSALPDITSRALTLTLRDLQDAKLITRKLVDDDPPRTEYSLTSRGRTLVPVLQAMLKCS